MGPTGSQSLRKFESKLRIREQIDLIMMNADPRFSDVVATRSLNLGSDHQAASVEVPIPCIKIEDEVCHVHRFPWGWRPDDRWNEMMKEAIGFHSIKNLDDPQVIFDDVSKEHMKKRIGKTEKSCRPLNSEILKELLKMRRIPIGAERYVLSKRTQKETEERYENIDQLTHIQPWMSSKTRIDWKINTGYKLKLKLKNIVSRKHSRDF